MAGLSVRLGKGHVVGKKYGPKKRELERARPGPRMSENPLLVFVSSVISDTEQDRRTVKETIEGFPFLRPWVFEFTPASADALDETYLAKVRQSDIFVLLVGDVLTDPVHRECNEAIQAGRRILAFVRGDQQPPDVCEFLRALGVKYARYETPQDLSANVQVAINDEIIKNYRSSYDPQAIAVVSENLAETRGVPASRDYLVYLTVGMEPDSKVIPLIQLLLARQLPTPTEKDMTRSEEMVFDDAEEVTQLNSRLSRLRSRLLAVKPKTSREFLKIWTDEALRPLLREGWRLESKRKRKPFGGGILYVKVGWHKDWAPFIKVLCMHELLAHPVEELPRADEITFESFEELGAVQEDLKRIVNASKGSQKRFMQLLAEAALKRAQQRLLDSIEE